jgi:ABC-type multidrug transport system permease subunit
VSFGTSLCVLVKKDFLNVARNPMLLQSKIVSTIFLSIYTAGLYCKFTGDYVDTLNWQSLTGYMFFITISTMMGALAPVELVFPTERPVFLKEEGAKLYSVFSYYMSRNIIELPSSFIFPLLQVLIMYWFAGLSNTAGQFFIHFLVAYLIYVNGISLGLMLGSMI